MLIGFINENIKRLSLRWATCYISTARVICIFARGPCDGQFPNGLKMLLEIVKEIYNHFLTLTYQAHFLKFHPVAHVITLLVGSVRCVFVPDSCPMKQNAR